jgi:hypothetical protein
MENANNFFLIIKKTPELDNKFEKKSKHSTKKERTAKSLSSHSMTPMACSLVMKVFPHITQKGTNTKTLMQQIQTIVVSIITWQKCSAVKKGNKNINQEAKLT